MTNFEELPELTAEQLAAMSESERVAYEELRQMGPAERVRFLGQVKVVAAAEKFLASVCDRQDLRTVWPRVDPVLRLCSAQQWIVDNARSFNAEGYDRDDVAAALANEQPDHPLWQHFERVHVRSISGIVPASAVRGIGTHTRMIAPDVEMLYVHDQTGREGSAWQPGEERFVFPIAMRWDGEDWLVASLGSESLPVPGWPPTF
ncbi:hypothetical protein AB0L63_19225 [Nocardia sp. NPDC051990]|uniref:hypothetical protein n=1 Tax=Nocardia sp. NPDC051990 TaxID=3155285 RepID=UPI003416827F